MPLTSSQKHYIKKNIGKLPIEKITVDLGLPEKEIRKYLKKQWGTEKYEKFFRKEASQKIPEKINSPGFKKFFADNINIFAFLFILILICYSNSIGNQFVSDDVATIKNNPEVGKLSLVFSNLLNSIQMSLYYVAFHLGGGSPWAFRIINISLHFGSTILLFSILNILANKRIAVFGAAIFAVHPILVESVAWIAGMPYALYSFFLLLSFLFYINSKERKSLKYLSLLSFFLAVMSSAKAIIFPGIIFAFEMSRSNLRKNWLKIAPFFFIDLFFVMFSVSEIGKRVSEISAVSYQDSSGMYNPLIQVPTAIANYFKLIFWPQKLSLYQTEMNFSPAQFTLIVIVFLIFLGFILYGWRKNKSLFFWLSFFFISLLPVLTPFKIAWVVAERYAYLGSIGIFVVAAMFFDWIATKLEEEEEKYKMAVYFIFAAIIIALSARTIARNIDWKDEDHLWIATAKVASSGPNIHNNLGDVYARNGDFEKAAEEFKKSIEINPNYGDAYHNLGNTYNSMGKANLAIENYQKALSINPNIWQSHQNLAGIYFNQGDYQKAYESIKKATEINPTDENLKKNLAIIEEKVNSIK